MQTYTHLLFGAAGAAIICSHEPIFQVAFIAGSIAPDVVIIGAAVIDKLKGKKQLLNDQGSLILFLKEPPHSLPLTYVLMLACTFVFDLMQFSPLWNTTFLCGQAFFAGMTLHIIIDIFTHCGEEFQSTDQSCAWPFNKWLPKLGSIFGIWEYRRRHGDFKPKKPEAIIDVCLLVTFLVVFTLMGDMRDYFNWTDRMIHRLF